MNLAPDATSPEGSDDLGESWCISVLDSGAGFAGTPGVQNPLHAQTVETDKLSLAKSANLPCPFPRTTARKIAHLAQHPSVETELLRTGDVRQRCVEFQYRTGCMQDGLHRSVLRRSRGGHRRGVRQLFWLHRKLHNSGTCGCESRGPGDYRVDAGKLSSGGNWKLD